jgi:hypothetical protein
MPFGPEPLGFAYFAGIKLAGYSAYAAVVNRSEAVALETKVRPSFLWVGLVRTLIGVSAGVSFGLFFWLLQRRYSGLGAYGGMAFFALLVPVRILEWLLLWRLFYRRSGMRGGVRTKFILFGIVVSFALDCVGIAAMMVIPGGAWIC